MVFFGVRAEAGHNLYNILESFKDNLLNKQVAFLMFSKNSFIDYNLVDEDCSKVYIVVYLEPLVNKWLLFGLTFIALCTAILINSYTFLYALIPFWVILFSLNKLMALVFIKGLRKQGYKGKAKVL